jgi:hypothetical protein
MREWIYKSKFSWPRQEFGVNGQLHAPAALSPVKKTGTHWVEGWVGSRADLDNVEKILDPTGTRNSDPSVVQARSQSLYRLS